MIQRLLRVTLLARRVQRAFSLKNTRRAMHDSFSKAGTQHSEAYRLPIEFTGSGSEYFRIWIVNLLLMFVTLGSYYPWAKVRRLRDFQEKP